MNILKQTDKGMLFINSHCRRLDEDYYVIAGLTILGQADYLLMKHDTLIYQNPLINAVIIKYNTIKKLYEQGTND